MRVYDGKLGVIFFFFWFFALVFSCCLYQLFRSNSPLIIIVSNEQLISKQRTILSERDFLCSVRFAFGAFFPLYFFVLISCNSLRLLQNNMDYVSCLCQHFTCWRARTPQPHTDDHANEAAKRKSQFNIWTIFATAKTLSFYTLYRSNNMVLK